MIRPKVLAAALAFASLPATAAPAGSLEDAMRLVPPDAVAALVVPGLKAASDDLQLAIDAAGKAEAALGGRPIDLLKSQLRIGAGLDDRGAFAAWATRGGNGAATLVMSAAFPVIDADEFVRAMFEEVPGAGPGAMRLPDREGTLFVRKAGSVVVVSADSAVAAWEPKDGFAAALEARVGRRGMEIVRTSDVFAWASAPVMREWSLRARAAAALDGEIARALLLGGGDVGMEEQLAEVAAHRARGGEILDQVEDAVVAADFDALAIGIRAWARFADGSELAKAIPPAGDAPRQAAALLGRLPAAAPYGAVGLDIAGMGGLAHLRSVLATLPEGDRLELPEWVDAVQEKVKGIQFAAYPSKLSVMVGGVLNDASLVVLSDDPAALRGSLKAWVARQEGERDGVRTEVTWQDSRELKDGSTASAFAVKETVTEQGARDFREAMARQMVVGSRGLHGFAREVPGALVVTFSQRQDVLDRATKAATGGPSLAGSPVVKAMLPWLVPDADAVTLLGFGQLLGVARELASAFPVVDPAMVPEAPAGLEPVAFAVRSRDRTWEGATVVPSRLIGVAIDAVRAANRPPAPRAGDPDTAPAAPPATAPASTPASTPAAP